MTKQEIYNLIDTIFAFDNGSYHVKPDEELRDKLRNELNSLCGSSQLYPDILTQYVREELNEPYDFEDIVGFCKWASEFLER